MQVKHSILTVGGTIAALFISPLALSTAAGQTVAPGSGVTTVTKTSPAAVGVDIKAGSFLAKNALQVGADGWSVLTKSVDTRSVYVSSSIGNDAYDGLSQLKPKRTIAAGYALLRNGYPDWLLLKAGDTWDVGLGHWEKGGRSPTERMVVSSFGTSKNRPLMRTGSKPALQKYLGGNTPLSVNNLAFMSLSFSAEGRPASNGPSGFSWLDGGKDILLEDCTFDKYAVNVSVQGFRGQVTNFVMRRCNILNSYDATAHAQGLYASKVDGLVVEECLFDHNGWGDAASGAVATVFNHGAYIQGDCGPSRFSNNLVFRSSSHGMQLRSGGTANGNLLRRNPLGLLMGGGTTPVVGGVTAIVKENVIVEGNDISPSCLRGYGIDLMNIKSGEVSQNIVANKLSTNGAFAIGSWVSGGPTGLGVQNLTISGNTIRDWRGGIQFIDPGLAVYYGVRIDRNVVASTLASDTAPLMSLKVPAEGITYSNDQYVSLSPTAFDYRNKRVSFSSWASSVGEVGASFTTSTSRPKSISFADAMTKAAKKQLTFEQAVEELKSRGRLEWPANYSTASLNPLFK